MLFFFLSLVTNESNVICYTALLINGFVGSTNNIGQEKNLSIKNAGLFKRIETKILNSLYPLVKCILLDKHFIGINYQYRFFYICRF